MHWVISREVSAAMEREPVRRRSVIGGFGAMITLSPVFSTAAQLAPNEFQLLRFHVAGARFHQSTETLLAGDELRLRRGQFRGEVCYSVLTIDGAKIGFVPRKLVPLIARGATARVFSVDPHAVPWKRVVIQLDRYRES
jgi:hypothetical protein